MPEWVEVVRTPSNGGPAMGAPASPAMKALIEKYSLTPSQ
jgi:hypothetical protein